MYDVIIGHYGEDKNIPFGGQKLSHRVENLYTGWRPQVLQHIFLFLKISKILDLWSFSKKHDFLKFFWVKKPKFKKSEIAIL